MKFLKAISIVVFGLCAIITLLSLLIPNKIITAKAITVQGDSTVLFLQISDLKNWKNWHPYFSADTSLLKLGASTNKVNDTAVWMQGLKKYRLHIVKKSYPLVQINIEADGEQAVENIFTLMPVVEQGNMQVQWQTILHLKWYPWEKFSGIFVEKMAGAGNEAALQSLKNYIEKLTIK